MTKIIVSATIMASLFAAPAFAADFGVVDQPAPAGFEAPVHDWTGFYAGVFGGLTAGESDESLNSGLVPPTVVPVNASGGLGGVQLGANYQMDQFVFGAVADFALTNHGVDVLGAIGIAPLGVTSELSSLATVRVRAGYAFGNLLPYVHGGVAYGRSVVKTPSGAFPEANTDRFGFTVGAGVEYALSDAISLQTEYSYTDLGEDVVLGAPGAAGGLTEGLAFHTVKAGVNFSF